MLYLQTQMRLTHTHHLAGPGFYPCRFQSRRPACWQKKGGNKGEMETLMKGRHSCCSGWPTFNHVLSPTRRLAIKKHDKYCELILVFTWPVEDLARPDRHSGARIIPGTKAISFVFGHFVWAKKPCCCCCRHSLSSDAFSFLFFKIRRMNSYPIPSSLLSP